MSMTNWDLLTRILSRWGQSVQDGTITIQLTYREGQPVVVTRYEQQLALIEACVTDADWVQRNSDLLYQPDRA